MLPRHVIPVPEYSLNTTPDYTAVGNKVDSVIRKEFAGQNVMLRYLSLQDHPGMTVEELVETIEKTGTDRYDPNRPMSVSPEFYAEKGVELFGEIVLAESGAGVTAEALKDFYEGAVEDRGYSLRIDLIVVYDLSQIEVIPIQYDDGIGKDAFKFRHPDKRAEAVLGFVILK